MIINLVCQITHQEDILDTKCIIWYIHYQSIHEKGIGPTVNQQINLLVYHIFLEGLVCVSVPKSPWNSGKIESRKLFLALNPQHPHQEIHTEALAKLAIQLISFSSIFFFKAEKTKCSKYSSVLLQQHCVLLTNQTHPLLSCLCFVFLVNGSFEGRYQNKEGRYYCEALISVLQTCELVNQIISHSSTQRKCVQ